MADELILFEAATWRQDRPEYFAIPCPPGWSEGNLSESVLIIEQHLNKTLESSVVAMKSCRCLGRITVLCTEKEQTNVRTIH